MKQFALSILDTHDHTQRIVKVSNTHVFLSYCRDNKTEAKQLHDDLVDHGFDVWRDGRLVAGQDWKLEIRKAIQHSAAVVACFSKEVQDRDSSGMFPELRDALDCYRVLKPGSVFLIPVRLSECELPDLAIDGTRALSDLHYVDLFPPSVRPDGLARLIEALKSSPRLKNSPVVKTDERNMVNQTIPHKAFRVGQGPDPIDDAITVIVFGGLEKRVESAVRWLEKNHGGPVPAYDHGDDIHEVMVRGPVASGQIALLANRYGVDVKSIDHVPQAAFNEFVTNVRRYLKAKEA